MKVWQFLLLSVLLVFFLGIYQITLNRVNPTTDPIPIQTSAESDMISLLVVPHHDIALSLSENLIKSVPANTEKIFLLSPNHSEVGGCDILSTKSPESFLESSCQNDSFFTSEHGVNNLVPILKKYHPQAKIVPIIFKKNISLSRMDSFVSKLLTETKKQNSLIVSSIDFSHGLNLNSSREKDQETLSLISSKNYSAISLLGPEHLDSPPALITILKISQQTNQPLFQIDHQSSFDFVGQVNEVTSYLTFSSLEPSKKDNIITLYAVGDIMLGRSVNAAIQKQRDFTFPAKKIASVLPKPDLFLANLESPFADSCPLTDSGMVFCADPRSIATLGSLGVTAVTIANNHIGNQGKTGLSKTIQTLNQNNVLPITHNQIIKIKNSRIAILAFNDIPPYTEGINKLSEDTLVNQIKDAKKQADFIVITPHWGNEYQMASPRQKKLAHLAIDSGADLIIGHHPHWVQEIEEYKGKFIFYSLGNFIFDQMWSTKTREGLIAKLEIKDNKVSTYSAIPIFINKDYQPEIVKR